MSDQIPQPDNIEPGNIDNSRTNENKTKDSHNNETKDSRTPKTRIGVWSGDFPTTVDLLSILGIFLVAQIISIAITYFLGYSFDRTAISSTDDIIKQMAQADAGMFSLVSYSITMTITIIGALALRFFRGGKSPIAKFSILGFNPSVLLWGMLLLISIAVIFDPLMKLLPPTPELFGRGWAMVLTLTVVAPIAEEFLCRGIILESVRAKSGVWAACTVSALFFAVLHMHPTTALNALIVGLMLSYLYIRTGSLFAPIILHSFNNALAYMLVWLGYEDVTLWEIVSGNKIIYFSIYALALVMFTASLIKIIRQLTRIKKARELPISNTINNK
ncbi:MAG: CPBP family intramembrane glutamic endopeptidase [Rikenellaceae bacterium]